MTFTASSLSFGGPAVNRMAELPKEIGVEIFYEWGSARYWEHALERIMDGRTGGFSVHSPFTHVDVSRVGNDQALFDELMEPFDLYHKYRGEFYVVHVCGHVSPRPDRAQAGRLREMATDRLARFDEICRREGVRLAVENIGFSDVEPPLFSHSQFLELFARLPQLHCLIDTGHANLSGFEIYDIQKELRGRLVAYHVHDNDGRADQHLRVGRGTIGWEQFAEGFRNFTPDAHIVMEYNEGAPEDYVEDRAWLRRLIGSY